MSIRVQIIHELAVQKHVKKNNYTKVRHLSKDIDETVQKIGCEMKRLEEDGIVENYSGSNEVTWRILL